MLNAQTHPPVSLDFIGTFGQF